MCFVFYAGTRNPLHRKKWEKDAPGLSVESLTERDSPIKAHFRSPEVQCIGSTSGCGCDFPHATLQSGQWPEIGYLEQLEQDVERVTSDKRNREALVDLLRESGDEVVEDTEFGTEISESHQRFRKALQPRQFLTRLSSSKSEVFTELRSSV